ncbi:beta-ketoacyl-[acyl-carrier-protein] synthase II [Lactococcus lactis subsp. lactis]|uniref:beta-ketoacyl-ACP synthase II n=1 Tax=Lactococcus lactis TaxID=1358 RepID=UPI000200CF32|nr:beta-ketoacyl-ACP synthase II [Lactococcus lactis]ADZ63397.1 3-oxoacyl-acyl-carrier-protein synthase II [Lactococcus lactis subsp. lactis CV56]KAF0955439.1 beta-ketoacyl-[acyl-carrier-protein] synthase II [Lactococcus lactis subsp. lactis]KSU25250.1 3-oxoacyl-(acyl-carrier-protein) synthase KASII [Lactococcus lactis subsp. lactis]MDU0402580.1 3-oxoacyl-[acyl-carrier-protein] synthase 2 [Lactococcus lactis]QQB12030.1 beta-ketoacyl-ACP synthase II [Lactococcus lactis]
MTNRVVITGYGVVSAIGNSPEEFWNNLKAGKTGIGPITHFDAEATGISVAAEVKEFPFDKYFQKKDARRMDSFSLYAVYAALDAMEMSGITEENTNFDRLGCIMASGIGGLEQSQKNSQAIVAKGPRKGVAPLYVPLAIANMATGNVALRTGARGVSRAEVTACAAGANSIGSAFREIKHGYADAMIAGGAEAAICELGIAGFANLTALTKETDPEKACIPFDKNRSGFVMGEGSGVLILESLEHAQARGANILAEIVGYGNTNDAFHMTTPSGVGAENAIKLALEEAGASPADVDYVNAHGTSTHANEETESKAIHNVIGDKAYVSSTKALHGHALGATGAIEAVATVQALLNQYAPVNAGTIELDEGMTINVVLGEGKPADINLALSQDFGFGGHNAVLAFKKWTGE